ncbi:MAG: glutamate--tRNA ligase [Candidatus Pacebacteria bacterium]|nr:glutamate--tRNA ligase [Candidatus Paceibacterota bacterium]
MNEKQVVTRMAPSPTGRFHVGGIRTAFYNYAFARKHGGKFILRIEDTDKERNKKEYEEEAYEVFKWVGMDYDEVYRQSEHLERHQEVLKTLIDLGAAYEAEGAKDANGKVIRFKNPNKEITFNDQILGEITVDTTDLGDFVIARNIDSPLYHLAVVVDDHDEGVTHVIRAQEHVANTPRQILLHEALDFETPIYAHVPFILGPDGKKKLSKRDANVAAMEYKENGFLPEAMLNFLSFIGWNPGTEQEVFSKDELVEAFSLDQVQKGPGGFNLDKLSWLNKQWLNTLSDEGFRNYIDPLFEELRKTPIYDEEVMQKITPIIRERISSYQDLSLMITEGELDYYFVNPEIDTEKVVWKKGTKEDAAMHLEKVLGMIISYSGDWNKDDLKSHIFPYADEVGRGDVLWPLRFSLSGRDKSPDPFTLLEILGKEISLQRIGNNIEALKKAIA